MRFAVVRISPSRWEIRTVLPPSSAKPADEGQQLAGDEGVEARCRLVEDDQPCRDIRLGEGPRDLDHLAPGERQVADDGVGRDAMAREDPVEHADDERAGLADANATR